MIESFCPKCGARFPPGTDHVCPKDTKKSKPHSSAPALEQAPSDTRKDLITPSDGQSQGVRGADVAANFDKTAYQKAYMVKWRAEQKRKKNEANR